MPKWGKRSGQIIKNADGTLQSELNAKGCSQQSGEHYNMSLIYSPVNNDDIDIMVELELLTLMVISWTKKTFSWGYPKGSIFWGNPEKLSLDCTIYGAKQAAMDFWNEFLKAHDHIGNIESKADPCSFCLIVWFSFIHDYIIIINDVKVIEIK